MSDGDMKSSALAFVLTAARRCNCDSWLQLRGFYYYWGRRTCSAQMDEHAQASLVTSGLYYATPYVPHKEVA